MLEADFNRVFVMQFYLDQGLLTYQGKTIEAFKLVEINYPDVAHVLSFDDFLENFANENNDVSQEILNNWAVTIYVENPEKTWIDLSSEDIKALFQQCSNIAIQGE